MLRMAKPEGEYSVKSATGFGMTDEEVRARVLNGRDAADDEGSECQLRDGLSRRKREAAEPDSARPEHLHAVDAPGRVGHDEGSGRRRVESAWLDDPTQLLPDFDDLGRGSLVRGDRVDGVPALVEHVVRTTGRLMKPEGLFEESDDVGRKAADRAEHLDGQRRAGPRSEQHRRQKTGGEGATHGVQYATSVRTALSTSAVPGRIVSSRTGA